MIFYQNDLLERMRRDLPEGTRVKLKKMIDEKYAPPEGTEGTVNYIDDAGNIHVSWDNGSSLSLIPEDKFTILKKE